MQTQRSGIRMDRGGTIDGQRVLNVHQALIVDSRIERVESVGIVGP